MKKVYLQKVTQKTKAFYVMVEDPRLIVELLPKVDAGSSQETQRPWLEKKVKEISAYVAGKVKINDEYRALGLIPNNPILVLNHPLKIEKEKIQISSDPEFEDRYFLTIPTKAEERVGYIGSIEALDGQHRLRAFHSDFLDAKFSDQTPYEMIFSVFEDLSINQRKEIFMITNEKQDKVSTNLIRFLKKALGLLNEDEEKVFGITEGLNKEHYSVLKGRIIFGSDKVPKGYQDNQFSKILTKSGTIDSLITYRIQDEQKKIKILSNYLKAWEEVYGVSFQQPEKDTLTKISGLRYVFFLFPTIFDVLMKKEKPATPKNFKDIIQMLPEATGINNVFQEAALAFRGEGGTVKMAKDHSRELITYVNSENSNFDPTEGI